MSNECTYGSKWRRWELHLHTPFTQKEDQYEGNTPEEKWELFYRTVHDYIGDGTNPLKAICTIAITDYLSIDNYMAICDHKRLPDCVKLILPNVELRMKPIATDSPINIHCIFSPEIANEIDDRFFAKLEFEYNHNRYSATRTQLVSLGRAYMMNPLAPEEDAYTTAIAQYVISSETLSNVFKNDPELRGNTIIAVSNKTTDGASGTRAHSDYFVGDISQLDATRRAIYQLSDAIYSSNPSDIEYFLGQRADDEETVKQKCDSLMPCIHGCDAHTNAKIFEPNNQRYCWIKADPTFEGLKQILYEPKERVKISATYPEIKQGYHVIDRAEIIGNDDFDPKSIHFSDNLTCIIGGKSTGKSLLLHNMAWALDAAQVKEKEETAATNVKQVPQLKVYWRDGVCSDTGDASRKIVYIPQTYLNRLSDEKEETTEIDSIIQDIVLQDANARQLFEGMNAAISAHKQLIAKTIVDFLQIVSDRNATLQSKKEIGDKDGIQLEISQLTTQLEQLSKQYDVTEDDVTQYQTAIEKTRQLSAEIKVLANEKEIFESMSSVLEKRDNSRLNISRFSDELIEAIKRTQSTADTHWLAERGKIISQIIALLTELQVSLSVFQSKIEELKPKMEGNEQISKTSALIVCEKEKLDKLSSLDEDLLKTQELYNTYITTLTSTFATYKSFYMTYIDAINDNFASPTEDLEFRGECIFRIEYFKQKLLEIVNNKSISRFNHIKLNDITEQDIFDSEKMQFLIEAIITNSSETLQLKAGHNPETALRDIFADWNNIDYVVTMDKDSIEDMSPGKKALVLLRLLISLAESKCPILIDQPEDDLDNRSIFDELAQFIKTKKVDRQIITVTHNANIVLGGDAELVIIANQDGKNAPNKAYRFEYRGGAIENNTCVKDECGNVQNGILNSQGIQTHICEILEGGERAFDLRRNKYRFIKQ